MIPKETLAFVLLREGVDLAKGDIGYVNDPDDPGGATAYGITQNVYNGYRENKKLPVQPVRCISYEEMEEIYEQRYWNAAKCDQFVDSRPRLALVHFDCAVNQGVGQAALCIQRAVGVTPDGIIGSVTLQAIRNCNEDDAIEKYLRDRARIYNIIVERRPASKKFLYGWLARLRWNARQTGVPIDASFSK